MPDREKVIKGLEVCTSKPCYCTDCPYKANCCLDSQEVMEDALILLKGQEPRVLTWAEVKKLPHGEEDDAPVVIEYKVPVETYDNGSICLWHGARFAREANGGFYEREKYGKVWRCWTALPTKAQKEAVKWDDA